MFCQVVSVQTNVPRHQGLGLQTQGAQLTGQQSKYVHLSLPHLVLSTTGEEENPFSLW